MRKDVLNDIVEFIDSNWETESDDFHFDGFYNEYILKKRREQKNPPKKLENEDYQELLCRRIEACYLCYLGKRRVNVVAMGYQNPPEKTRKQIMLLLDIPSIADRIAGDFYGQNPVSALYKNILSALSLDYKEVYTTSLVKCYSATELPNDLSKIEVCREYFDEELGKVKPHLVIAMGELTYKLLLGKDDFEQNRGKKITYLGCNIVFTYHPREISFDKNYKRYIWNDLQGLQEEMKNGHQ